MASNTSVSGQITNSDSFVLVTNNSLIAGNRLTDEFTLFPSANAGGQPLTLSVTANNSSGVFDTYLEIVDQFGNLIADSDDNGSNSSSLIAPGQPTNGPGSDNPLIPNSLTLNPGETYTVRLLSFSSSPVLPADYILNATVPSGDITLIPRNTTLFLTRPTVDTTPSTDLSGVTPINAASGDFYNLSDGSDNVNLNPALTNGKIVRGLGGSDRIQGSTGSDSINGNTGADTVFGGDGSDDLRGGKGSDSLVGENGDDLLFANDGNDTLEGRDGNDLLRGGQNSDVLLGGNGDDTLIGDLGFDILTGGADNDTFVLRGGVAASATTDQADLITDFGFGSDRLGLADGITFNQLLLNPISVSFESAALSSTSIYFIPTGVYLGTVLGVSPISLSAINFTSVSF
jgi:Ca2+-binding RTX toxin-like protein